MHAELFTSSISRLAYLFALLSPIALVNCSGSDDANTPGGGGDLGAFSKYCTGTLTAKQDLMNSMGPGAWSGNGTAYATAGTSFLVTLDFDRWGGLVIGTDGAPAKIDADFGKGLVKDTDFTSDCATDSKTATKAFVVLKDSTFYATAELTGTACKVPAVTRFTQYSFTGAMSGAAQLTSQELKQICGFETGYSNDMVYGSLVVR